MQLNNTTLVDRQNRPQVNQRVGLRAYFINDGAYVDPFEVSSVKLFKNSAIVSGTVLDTSTNLVSGTPLMTFANDSALTSSDDFDEVNYTPGTAASGIYRKSVGEYVCVLDQILDVSGYDETTASTGKATNLSAVLDYVDIWTVKLTSASEYQVYVNKFKLYEDTFFSITEPLQFKPTNKLYNKHLRLGEKVDLRIGTELAVVNQDISDEIKNIFKTSVINNASLEIKKVNQDHNFDGPFTVSGYSDTASLTSISSDNTISMLFDTNNLTSLEAFQLGNFGSVTGTYSVQVKYDLLNQTIISPLFYFTVS
jgi:hypothetical protein